MSTPSDQQLLQYIGQGRREALATLFERYSADLYDYLARLVGDRDQAARLLDTVFMRVPGAAPGVQARDSARGWLYSLAREAGLDWLRQRGWLDGLPPSDEAIAPGFLGDVWKAARTMPAFFRAVLITEELQPLSPSEKARALGVNRTDLPRLIDEARRSFNRIYDAQARAEGRPTSDLIDPNTVWNARRRLPIEGGSLFGFLPIIPLPDSLNQQIRRHVVEAMSPTPPEAETPPADTTAAAAAGAIAGAAAAAALNSGRSAESESQPELFVPPPPPQAEPREIITPAPVPPPPPPPRTVVTNNTFGGGGLSGIALPAIIGMALALLLCAGVYLLTQNRSRPSITNLQPANGATVQQAPQITVFAEFRSDRNIDRTKTTMQIDGGAVPPQFVNNSVAWSGPLGPGSHNAAVVLVDEVGNTADATWAFFVTPGGVTAVPSPSGVASITPIPSVTPIVPVTAEVVTVTPIILTATPIFATATPVFPTFPPPPPPTLFPYFTLTPCSRGGVAGVTFNDLNGNGVRDPNEPGLAGVVVNLVTLSNSIYAVGISDTFGNYRFSDVPFGQYRVQAVTPNGWYPTSAQSIPVNLFGCGMVTGFNFGFAQTPVNPSPSWTPVTPIIVTVTPSWTPIVITATPTPTNTPPPPVVTNVSANVTPPSSPTCPETFTFNGSITTSGPANVTYQWVRSDGALSPTQVLSFFGPGTQNVNPDAWYFPGPAPFNFSGWERLQVLSPNSISSPQAFFMLNCVASSTPTDTPTPTATATATGTVPPPFNVTNVTAAVTPTASTTCPETFTSTGDVTVTGTGVVTYQWIRSVGGGQSPQTLTFLVPGTQSVTPDSWNIPGASPFIFSGWTQLHILTPNVMDSPQVNFTLNCP